jgi:hypothetical protein
VRGRGSSIVRSAARNISTVLPTSPLPDLFVQPEKVGQIYVVVSFLLFVCANISYMHVNTMIIVAVVELYCCCLCIATYSCNMRRNIAARRRRCDCVVL